MANKKKPKAKKVVYKKVRKTNKKPSSKPVVEQQSIQTIVELSKAKGRPMLMWVGKKPLERLTAFPAQKVEEFTPPNPPLIGEGKGGVDWSEWTNNYPKSGLLFHGDNKEVLAHLLANGFRGKVKLIYIDPPFDSGADYVRKIQLRDKKDGAKVGGEDYSLGEQIQYQDIWTNDLYLQFMYDRLSLLKELLDKDGSIYLHCDWHKNYLLRCLLDEVFGQSNFRNEIIWYYPDKFATGGKSLDKNHDVIYHYSKSDDFIGNEIRIEKSETTKRALRKKVNGKTIDVLDENGNKIIVEYSDKIIDDVWQIGRSIPNNEYTGYPTQKKDDLIIQILEYGTNPGDIVLDCFIGSGTTAAVAQKLGRRWIGCDINKGAIQTTSKRLQTIISEQIEEQKKKSHQGTLDLGDPSTLPQKTAESLRVPEPAQNSFSVYRVNDYDLQIQHNEAVNLACEHIGITRSKTDSFFEGTRGKKLVKIVPFNHPVTQLDLEQIKNELKARPNESRDIVVVSLGKELATDTWLTNWNKLRTKGDVPNKIELIELRTDKKYGKFIEHKPSMAKISIKRVKDKVAQSTTVYSAAKIVIENFISPTIIERLSQQEGPLRPQITDWRSMVDCVMIDPNYDGKVFTIALSDVPEKKNDFVVGEYEIPIDKKKATVAIKIIDMLGEEVIVMKEV